MGHHFLPPCSSDTFAKPTYKLDSILESVKENPPEEYSRLAFDTIKNKDFLKKITMKKIWDTMQSWERKLLRYVLRSWKSGMEHQKQKIR